MTLHLLVWALSTLRGMEPEDITDDPTQRSVRRSMLWSTVCLLFVWGTPIILTLALTLTFQKCVIPHDNA